MIVTIIGAAYVTEPLPGIVALAARLAGSSLAGYLVWVSLRGAPPPTAGWQVGWPVAAAVAIVAFAIGWLASGTIGNAIVEASGGATAVGAAAALASGSPVPRAAFGAALALTALAAAPVLLGGTSCARVSGCCCCSPRSGCCATSWRSGPTARSSSRSPCSPR